jgi:hypothetical protein
MPTATPTPDPWAAFIGTWVSTSDLDGGTQTMSVERSSPDSLGIVVTDTIASVCSLSPSTMTGSGRVQNGVRLLIRTPDYRCDDGSTPRLTNGDPTPLNEVLRNLAYVLAQGTLVDSNGGTWRRDGSTPTGPGSSVQPSAKPTAASTADPTRAL